jgi:hypothetical protein
MESDIATQYKKYAIAGKREVELNIVGFDENRELWDFFKDVWNSANDYYNTASGRLNSKLKLSRDDTYDYFILSVYNWLIEEHNAHFVNVDDAIKNVDVVLVDGTPDSNKRIFDSFSIVNQVSKTDMHNS